jgi:hypothetical protein
MMLPQHRAQRPRPALRHLLADRGYQEVVNFAFVEEAWERDFCANDRPDPPRQPDRQPDERDALEALAGAGAMLRI